MTREEIMAMVPGRELDAMIAEKIMKWEWIKYRWWDGTEKDLLTNGECVPHGDDFDRLGDKLLYWDMPNWSDNIMDSWEVVGKVNYLYLYRWDDQPCEFIVKPGEWECKLTDRVEERFIGIGKTAPEAICKAALLTLCDN